MSLRKSTFAIPVVAAAAIVCLAVRQPGSTVRADGKPIYLSAPKIQQALFQGQDTLVGLLNAGQARPLSLASTDFDTDGVADLATGYATAAGGRIAIFRGNLDAFAPQSQQSFEAIGRGEFPLPFQTAAQVVAVPDQPDFLAEGMLIGHDGHALLAAARGGKNLYVVARNSSGGFEVQQTIPTPGAISGLAAYVSNAGGYSHVVVGVHGDNGPALLTFTGSNEGLTQSGSFPLTADATAFTTGNLDGDGRPDVLMITGGQLSILHGGSRTVQSVSVPFTAVAATIGSFLSDRDTLSQIALLSNDGTVHILAHNAIDSRPFSMDERRAQRRIQIEHAPNRVAAATSAERNVVWKEIESFPGAATFDIGGLAPQFFKTRIADNAADDIMLLGAGHLTVIAHPGQNATSGVIMDRAEPVNSVVAALSQRVNIDGRPGIVFVRQDGVAPFAMMPLPDPTYYPNRFDDPAPRAIGSTCANTGGVDGSNDCTLREAIRKANANGGTDTIMLQAGNYTLSQARQGSVTYDATAGSLDVTDSLNIVGATSGGAPASFILGGSTSSNGVDQIFRFNPDESVFTNATISISNLDIKWGFNRGSIVDAGQDGDGGAIEFDTGGSNAGTATGTLSITNCVIESSQLTDGEGGGLALFNTFHGSGNTTISNSTIQNNTARRGATGGTVSQGGGIWLAVTASLTMTNTNVLNNIVATGSDGITYGAGAGILFSGSQTNFNQSTIHGGSISGNSGVSQGAGIYNAGALVIDQGTVISNNSSVLDGGGMWSFGRSPGGTPQPLSITNATITGNHANGTISGGNGGVGGGIFAGTGTSATIHFTRFAGNTSHLAGSNNLFNQIPTNATNNWWGTNAPDPTIADDSGGVTTFDPFIVLTHTASPNKIKINQTTTLTADMSKDNHGTSIGLGNLGQIIGLPIAINNPVDGTITGAQTSIQSTATATATFNAGSVAGGGKADAVVDQQTTTANIIVLQPPSITKTFAPTKIPINVGVSTITFAVHNPNVVTIDSSFTDTFTSGMQVAAVPNASNTCGGTWSPVANATSVTFTQPALPIGNCTIKVDVKGTTETTVHNSVTINSSDAGTDATSTSSADLIVYVPPILAITKAHVGTFTQGQTATWTLQVANNSASTTGTTDGTTVTVNDVLPSGYTVSAVSGTNWTCGGVGTQTANCTSTDVVNGLGGLFPLITMTVNVPAASPVNVTNTGKVYGGGDLGHTSLGTAATGSDSVTVIQVPAFININGSATQSAQISTAFGSLAVTVQDAGHVAIPNYSSAVFTASTGGGGQSGTFDNSTNTKTLDTDGSGIANPGTFTANAIPGAYTVDVAAGPATHATFNLTNTAPDLTAVKSDNVSNATTLGTPWTWKIHLANPGNGAANFTTGQTILTDNLPSSNIGYGSASTSGATGITGTISCSIASNTLSCTASGAVSIAASGAVDVTFVATPTAIGTFVNPTGGVCAVDPLGVIPESNEGNNTCSDTVTVTAPDLTAVKTDNVANATTLGTPWTWKVHLANAGNAAASFTTGQTILTDNLPSTTIAYGSASTSGASGITGTINCAIATNTLSCTASGAVSIAASGAIDVSFTATPSAIGVYVNPTGGVCKVDPGTLITESDETNNTCTDTVTVTAPDLTAVKTDNVSNATTVGNSWTWKIHVANSGNAPANFANGVAVLADVLPTANISYGAASMTNATGITGTVNCAIASNILQCTASGAASIAAAGSFDVSFLATPSATGSFVNPTAGNCAADPGGTVTESNEANNACSDTVTVTGPDLTALKTNDVSGTVSLGGTWTWKIHLANIGNAAAGFTTGQAVLTDNLPVTNIGYGGTTIANQTGITGTISCAIASNILTCSASNAVSIAAAGSFDVSFVATPTSNGSFVNPTGGVCAADPGNVVVEASEANNSCSDTVTVTAADLTAVKSNNVSGTATAGLPWTWKIHLANAGNGAAAFANGTAVLTDNLPATNIVYGAASTSNSSGITGTIACTIVSNTLSCSASGPVSFAAASSIDVSFTATASVAGSYVNPTGGVCAVDPNSLVSESNEGNNSCSDTVTVNSPDLTALKTDNVSNAASLGGNWTWKIHVANGGTAAAGFANGNTVLTDNLPSTNIGYGSASMSNASGITGTINCSIASNTLSCTASGAVSIAASGAFDVSFVATPTANGTFVNPTGGVCAVDPSNVVVEASDANNSCSDTVTVTAPDLTVAKGHSPSSFIVNDAGDSINITVTNAGSGPSSGTVTVTDTLPSGLTFASSPSAGWSCNAGGSNPVICTSTTAIPGSSGTSSLTLLVNVAGSTGSPLTNNVSVACTCTESNTGNNSNSDSIPVLQTVGITLATSPTGLQVSGDGGSTYFTAPHTFQFAPGTQHTIVVTSPQSPVAGTQYVWQTWSDAGAISHQITAPGAPATITATFKTQYLLTTTAAASATYGNITPASGYYDSGAVVSVGASANTGYVFTGFSGGLSGTTTPQNVTMSAPVTVTANFTGGATSLGGSLGVKSGAANARIWPIVIGNNGPGVAVAPQVSSLTLTQTSGASCTPVVGSTPVIIADIAAHGTGTANVTIDFTGCASNAFFTATVHLSANGGAATATVTKANQLQ